MSTDGDEQDKAAKALRIRTTGKTAARSLKLGPKRLKIINFSIKNNGNFTVITVHRLMANERS